MQKDADDKENETSSLYFCFHLLQPIKSNYPRLPGRHWMRVWHCCGKQELYTSKLLYFLFFYFKLIKKICVCSIENKQKTHFSLTDKNHSLGLCFWTTVNEHSGVRYWNEWRWMKWGMPMTSTTSLIWFVQCGWLSSRCGKIFLEDLRSRAVPH